MKLNLPYVEFLKAVDGKTLTEHTPRLIDVVLYDSRRITNTENSVFFAIKGDFRDGHNFIADAYEKGVRCFVISDEVNTAEYNLATFIKVHDALGSLQSLAGFHRQKFSFPIIAITGSSGKTSVKEWLYHLIGEDMRVIRSPKSYNSQLGVALSLLELNDKCDVAIIEAGISQKGEMHKLEAMIGPTYGIFSSFGSAHAENFWSGEEHLNEKLELFKNCQKTFISYDIRLTPEQEKTIRGEYIRPERYKALLEKIPYPDRISKLNGLLAIGVADFMAPNENWTKRLSSLPKLAMRLETFEGINNNIIINDTYSLDLDAFRYSLEFQKNFADTQKRVVIIGVGKDDAALKSKINEILSDFEPDAIYFVEDPLQFQVEIKDSVVLIKGTRKTSMERLANQLRLKKHTTYLEVDFRAIRNNLTVYRKMLKPETKMLAMVKAQAYGTGLEKTGRFLQEQGVNYLGVAYVDEGVELRKSGVSLPILVMNAEMDGFEDCIKYELEPAIYSFEQLDEFIKEAIFQGIQRFPVHLKLETGMHRLGFEISQVQKILDVLNTQPEVIVKSVYTHLAESDNRRDKRFTEHQIKLFKQGVNALADGLNYSFDKHVLNTEGIANFSEAQFEMVRLGIGLYGVSENPVVKRKLKPVITWKSSISQIKTLHKGDSVGYSRTFISKETMRIAVIPVGYADGFRRSLGNGVGGVFIGDVYCPTVGRVCMDMIMVDVTSLEVDAGAEVEIIGEHQTVEKLADSMGTIAYEVLTSLPKRVHRIYIEEGS